MCGFYWALIIYFGIGLCIYIAICMGTLDLDIQSKATGEFLEPGTKEYETLKLTFSLAWIIMAIQQIARGSDNDGKNS